MKKKTKFLASLLTPMLGLFAIAAIPTLKSVNATSTPVVQEPLIKYDFAYMDEQVEMPILGYMGVPGDAIVGSAAPSFLTRANIQAYKDAGFNILSGLYEKVPLHIAEVNKALEICEELNLTYFVCDNKYRSDYDKAPTSVPTKDHFKDLMLKDFYFESPAFGGIAVRDEPNIHCFDSMGNVNAALQEIDNTKMVYTNLFPKGANQKQLGFNNSSNYSSWEQYIQYVEDYITKVKPLVLSYDCYVVTRPNSTVSSANQAGGVVGNYIRSLSMFRSYAKQNNIPFWVTVASHDHVRSKESIPIKQTQWTVNTSLAYGAQGVQYYTYWNDGATTKNMQNWADQSYARSQGLVSFNGALHDNYYRIQKINNQIKLIDHILMQADHKGIMQFGIQHLELMAEDVLYSYGMLRDVSGDAFVGCFDYKGDDVYYVVNNSLDSGIKTFKADFVDTVNVKLISSAFVTPENPEGVIIKNNVSSVGFNLTGGEGVLVEVLKWENFI